MGNGGEAARREREGKGGQKRLIREATRVPMDVEKRHGWPVLLLAAAAAAAASRESNSGKHKIRNGSQALRDLECSAVCVVCVCAAHVQSHFFGTRQRHARHETCLQ
jgi:hypothetical protein